MLASSLTGKQTRKQPCPPLIVATEGIRSFVNVPSGFAADLHQFLRAHSVLTSPPEPLWTGTDCIQLLHDILHRYLISTMDRARYPDSATACAI